jgi:hypothetical protein
VPEQARDRGPLLHRRASTLGRELIVSPGSSAALGEGFAVPALYQTFVLKVAEGGVDRALAELDRALGPRLDAGDQLQAEPLTLDQGLEEGRACRHRGVHPWNIISDLEVATSKLEI